VGGHWLIEHIWGRSLQCDADLLHAEALTVPLLGEVVGVIDKAGTAPDSQRGTAHDVAGLVKFLLAHVQTGAVSENSSLCESLSLEKLGEGVIARVRFVDFLDLNCVVTKEVVAAEILVSTIVGAILPQDGERKDAAVIVQETLEVLVGAATLKLDFHVFLHFSLIMGHLLHVNHGTSVYEGVRGKVFFRAEINALSRIELTSKFITVNNAEHAVVDV